jgi:hypothetical protein
MSGHRMSVIAEWIGNSESVARKHYLGVTDHDFQRAQDLNPFTSIVRQVVQHPAAKGCTASHKKNQGSQQANKKGHLHVPARPCSPVQMASATPVGFEALGSYPLFTSLKRIPANQLGANADNSHVIGYSVTLDSH